MIGLKMNILLFVFAKHFKNGNSLIPTEGHNRIFPTSKVIISCENNAFFLHILFLM
jgi:hypothetical protein